MSKSNDTVIRRYWKRVIHTPAKPSVLIKNPTTTPTVVPVVSPAGGHVAVIPPLPHMELSFGECGKRVAEIMAFLRANGFKKGDRAAILSWNCAEWVWTDFAVQSLGGVTVPIYPNTGPEQVAYLLKDSSASFIFASDDAQMEKVSATIGINRVVITETKMSSVTPMATIFAAGQSGPELARIEQALLESTNKPFLGVSLSDPATIIYTSGSTGQPKGVVLTHEAFATECDGLGRHGLTTSDDDVYLSYLPLAHVFERSVAALCAWNGIPTFFCKVEEMPEALKTVRPTVFVGVPAVWRKIKDKIQGQLDSATGLKAKLVRWAFAQKTPGFKRWLADTLVFKKIRAGLGGRLRVLLTGGAAISPEIIEFFNSVGLPLLQGYGLTETTAGLSVNTPENNRVGSVGRVLDGVELKLVPVEGRGPEDREIWVRGATVTRGYWNLPEETAKAITADGWFKTGDLGKLDDDGYLYITGRAKRMLKTDGGKFLAPEKVEKALDGDAIVQYIVPVGDGKPYFSALVFVNELNARELLSKAGITLGATATVAASYETQPEVRKLIDQAVGAAIEAGNKKLEKWEGLKKFRVVPVEATVANGLLTATLKIRSEEVMKRYGQLVEELYRK